MTETPRPMLPSPADADEMDRIPDAPEMATVLDVLTHSHFVGLWTYRPYGGHGSRRIVQFCASVMIDGVTSETEMHEDWKDALWQAARILAGEE